MSKKPRPLTNGLRVYMVGNRKEYQLIVNGMVTDVEPAEDITPLTPGLYDLELNYLGLEGPDGGLLEA